MQMELRVLIGCRDGEITPNHAGGPNVSTRVLANERRQGSQSWRRRCAEGSRA